MMVIRAKRTGPRRKVAREFALLQDVQKEDKLSLEMELRRSQPVLMMGIRETPTSSTSIMNWDPESSSEKGTCAEGT